jgi:hypothetical protein
MQPNYVNRNIDLYYERTYLGMPIQIEKGPFVLQYLNKLHQTLARSLKNYREVFAFRFDLRFPLGTCPTHYYENQVIDRFVESFKSKIRHNRAMAYKSNGYAHNTVVRYVWTKEVGQLGRPHYHIAVMLNYDAYCSLGWFKPGRKNMFNRIEGSWASALGIPISDVIGLVEVPRNPAYRVSRDDQSSIDKFFFRASYLCKSATKSFGNGGHGFGASRI